MPKPHEWQPEHLRLAIAAAGVALWAWNVDTDEFTMDQQGFELWGVPWRHIVTFEELSAHIHPADRDRVRSAFTATRAILGPYETDFRIIVGDEVRWIAARGQGDAALLGDLLSVLLAPYDDLGAFKGRIRVAVERMGVGQGAATGLALVIHELATNAVKYGALSVPTGTLDISSVAEGKDIVLTWLERGGPEVASPEGPGGFGSKLVQRSVTSQLGGAIDYNWDEGGLIVTLRMERSRLAS